MRLCKCERVCACVSVSMCACVCMGICGVIGDVCSSDCAGKGLGTW